MSVTGVSGTNLVTGSLTLTRVQAEARGMTPYETTNQMTGDKSESFQVSLSGYSLSLLKNAQGGGVESAEPTQMGNFVAKHYAGFGPTQSSLIRMDALRTAAAEDRPAVEQAFANQLAQSGVDPASSFTMTRTFDPDSQQYQVNVGHDFAKWRQVEDVFNNNPALFNDIQRVWEQQVTLASMRIVEGALQESTTVGQSAIDQVWLDHGSNDLAQSKSLSDTLDYRVGQIVSPSMEVADKVRREG